MALVVRGIKIRPQRKLNYLGEEVII